jgi:hypothetical protein
VLIAAGTLTLPGATLWSARLRRACGVLVQLERWTA